MASIRTKIQGLVFWTIILLLFVNLAHSQRSRKRKGGDSEEAKLISHFTKDEKVNNKYVRPSRTFNESLDVKIGFTLISILEVDSKRQSFKFECFVDLEWMDYRIMWLPSEHDNINQLLLPVEEIWSPDVVIKNRYIHLRVVANLTTWFANLFPSHQSSRYICRGPIFYSSDGNAFCSTRLAATVWCPMTMAHYPFDRHQCQIKFESYMHDITQVNVVNRTSDINVDGLYESAEWKFVNGITKSYNRSSANRKKFSTVSFQITIERRCVSGILIMMVPGCIMSLMVPLVLVAVPGERVVLGVGLEVGFLILLIANMPHSAGSVAYIPYLVLYFIVNFLLVAVALVASQIVAACVNKPAEFAVDPELKKYIHSRDVGQLISWILFSIFLLASLAVTSALFYAIISRTYF